MIRKSEQLMSLASYLAKDIATLRSQSSGGQIGCAIPPPQAPVNVEANKKEARTSIHPYNDQFIGNCIGLSRTHSSN